MLEATGTVGAAGSPDIDRLREALADRYAIERELGSGGMATVYLAQDLKHDRPVAIKVMRQEVAESVGSERFLREIEICARLNHPHILMLIDSGEADGFLYYVMPYVEGESLRELISRKRQLSIEEAVQIAREVADGLSYAHSYGVVHRDIKPENILFSGGHAVLADFGVARAVGSSSGGPLTETGLAIGTPWYMSPEQAAGDPRLDGRSDIYAMGCVLYEMLAGEPPFTGPTPQAVMARHSIDAPPPLRTVRQNLPVEVELTIDRALAKVPADRFETASQFATSLTTPVSLQALRTSQIPAPQPPPRRRLSARHLAYAAVAVLAALVVYLTWPGRGGPGAGVFRSGRVRLVVLPFQNLGPAEDEYFSDGITEEVTGRLASLGQLGVIARTSAVQYKNTAKPVSVIGDELSVDYVIEGSVRWLRPAAGPQTIRVNARLIKVSDGTPAWSQEYNVQFADVFTVQMNIAEQVSEALDVVLLQPEKLRLAARPTENLEAYDYYLRGNHYYNRSWERSDVESALAMYWHASQLDPGYALALAATGRTHLWIHRLGFDVTEERLRSAKAAIDSALALDPDLPEAHIALGLYHYWGRWDYERAIEEFSIARMLQPENAWVYLQIGNIRRRQGEWEQAIQNYEMAGELDPRFHIIWFNIADVYLVTHRYAQADRYLDRTIAIAPEFLESLLLKGMVRIHRDGDVEAARRLFDDAAQRIAPAEWRPLRGIWMQGFTRMVLTPEEGLERAKVGEYGLEDAVYHAAAAEFDGRLGDEARSLAQYDSARVALEAFRARSPDQAWIHGTLAVAYAGLGRRDEALQSARRATRLTPIGGDAYDGPEWVVNEARVHMMLGDQEAALDDLDLALAVASRISPNWVRLDPVWAPLRENPRFHTLVAGRQ